MIPTLSLRHLIPLLFFASGLILVTAFYVVGRPATIQQARELALERAQIDIQSLQGRLNAVLFRGDVRRIGTDIFFAATNPRVEFLAVVEPDGTILSAHRSKLIGENIFTLFTDVHRDTLAKAITRGRFTLEPVEGDENRVIAYAGLTILDAPGQERYVGLVQIEDFDDLIANMSRIASFSSELMLVLIVTLALVLARVLNRRLSTRLVPLIDGARHIAAGKENVRIGLKGEDEFAELSHAFDDMSLQIDHNRTDLIKTRDMAEAANQAQSQFLAGINHEIRTPLTGVIGYLDLLSNQNIPPRAEGYVAAAEQSARSLLTLIDDVLDASRLQDGNNTLKLAPVCLNLIVQQVVDGMMPDIRAKDLALGIHSSQSDPIWIESDARVIRQIMLTLVSNAIKFTPSGRIDISIEVNPRADGRNDVLFSVSDTGIGMSDFIREQLLEGNDDVLQGSNTTRSGLGFSICRQMVLLLDGTIDIDSHEGQGSRFLAKFVATPCAPQILENSMERLSSLDKRRLNILCLEADYLGRTLLENMLQNLGHDAACFADADSAFESLGHTLIYPDRPRFDLAIIDSEIVGIAVNDFIARLRRANSTYARLPTIIISTRGEDERTRFTDSGANGFIQKPFSTNRLSQEIFAATRVSQIGEHGDTAAE